MTLLPCAALASWVLSGTAMAEWRADTVPVPSPGRATAVESAGTDVQIKPLIGSRVLGMSFTADFDGDGRPDLAVPSLDRRSLRLIAFTPPGRAPGSALHPSCAS